MITPAYAPTATERVLPRLALDFTTGVLDPRVTVTRALNTATAVNSSGYIAGINANLPRFDYDPVTLAPKGLLIEETRTNVLTYSQDWSNSAWTKNNVLLATETILAPDGLVSVDKIIANTVNIAKFTAQTGLTSTTGTFSVYAKAAGETVISIWLANATQGASFTLTGNGSTSLLGATASTITPVGNGWYRCTVYYNAASTTAHIYLRLGSSFIGDGVSGVYLRAAQFEAGAFATSYIPTTTTSLTRNLDVVLMTGTNFSSWYNATEGTFLVQYVTPGTDPDIGAFSVSDSTANNALYHYAINGLGRFVSTVAGSTAGVIGLTGATAYSGKFAACYGGATIIATENAKTPVSAANSGIPVVNQIQFGAQSNGARLNGCVSKFFYWPQKFTSAQLQANSK